MSNYRFKAPPPQPTFGPLPEDDYDYVVAECGEPYESAAGNTVLPVKLSIQPDGAPVFSNPWKGTDKNGKDRDGIAEFLISCNRAPKEGEEPNWTKVVGARGRCRLKVEVAAKGALAGKEVNKVAWFYAPKQLQPGQSYTKAQAEQIRADAVKAAGGPSEDEPNDIPF